MSPVQPILVRLADAASHAPNASNKEGGPDFQTVLADAHKEDKEKVSQVATQFEALIIGQVLKSAQESAKTASVDGESDSSTDSFMDMGHEYLAQSIAANGGLGIAKMIVGTLARQTPKPPTAG